MQGVLFCGRSLTVLTTDLRKLEESFRGIPREREAFRMEKGRPRRPEESVRGVKVLGGGGSLWL